MASSLCLPQQRCQVIPPLLLKVIPVVPSPPQGCARALLLQASPHVLPPGAVRGHSFTPGMAPEEPLPLQPPGPAGGQGQTKLGSTNQPYCWAFCQGAVLPSFHPDLFSQLGEALWHGQWSLCWGYDVPHQHQCMDWLCRPAPGACIPGSLSALKLPEHV